ncbi:universal stress protein [Streptomyces tauricus]|uniref:universal stress protein n=1 Tax=Streptomyces tauricus TaxID=68274 RepID=UPI00387EF80A
MTRTVTVGIDGSPESRAAAEWAAREAELRGLPLKIINVWEPVPQPMAQAPLLGAETHQHWTERIPREAADGIRRSHPGLTVIVEQPPGQAGEVLSGVAKGAELLVLGSRGLSGIGGFLVGSVGLTVVAHAERPVVLVRAREHSADQYMPDLSGPSSASVPYLPVVLGLDTDSPDASVIEFAFEAAARRATSLRVVHGWTLPPYFAYGLSADPDFNARLTKQYSALLADVLRPWRQKFPSVEVVEVSRSGRPANHLVDASRKASMVVVGRRIRRHPIGARVGPVTHAILHHVTVPVAVVPHE